MRQPLGQSQDNFNFGPSLLKLKVLKYPRNCSLQYTLIPNFWHPLVGTLMDNKGLFLLRAFCSTNMVHRDINISKVTLKMRIGPHL